MDDDTPVPEPVDQAVIDAILAERGERLAGITGGVLLCIYNKRMRSTRSVYNSLKFLFGVMETNPAVKAYIGKLRPMDEDTDDSFLDWMSRFLFGFVDLTVGKMTRALVRKQSCVETYFKVCVQGHLVCFLQGCHCTGLSVYRP